MPKGWRTMTASEAMELAATAQQAVVGPQMVIAAFQPSEALEKTNWVERWVYHPNYGVFAGKSDARAPHADLIEEKMGKPMSFGTKYDEVNRGYAYIEPERKLIRLHSFPSGHIPDAVLEFYEKKYPKYGLEKAKAVTATVLVPKGMSLKEAMGLKKMSTKIAAFFKTSAATVDSTQFKAWFDGSKVVDANGQPLRVYHGTRSSVDFEEFSTEGPPMDEGGEYPVSSGSGADKLYQIKWQKGGTDPNVQDVDLELVGAPKAQGATASKTAAGLPTYEQFVQESLNYNWEGKQHTAPMSSLLAELEYQDEVELKPAFEKMRAQLSAIKTPVTVYRKVYLENGIKDLRLTRIGGSWSDDEAHAQIVHGPVRAFNNENVWTLKASVPESSIDWQQTIWLRLTKAFGEKEREIRVQVGAPITLLGYKKEGGEWEGKAQAVTAAGAAPARAKNKNKLSDIRFEFGEANGEWGFSAWAPEDWRLSPVGGVAVHVTDEVDGTVVPWIFDIGVDDDWRGTGLGQKLYDLVIAEAKKRGYDRLLSSYVQEPAAVKAWGRLSQRYPVQRLKNKQGEKYFSLKIAAVKVAEGFNDEGFWAGEGNAASGVLLICPATGRIGLAWRSPDVHIGDVWGTVGGAVKKGMTPQESAKEELGEETGYRGGITLHPAFVFTA